MNTKLMEVMKAVSEAAAEKEELEGLALSLNTQVKELRESLVSPHRGAMGIGANAVVPWDCRNPRRPLPPRRRP